QAILDATKLPDFQPAQHLDLHAILGISKIDGAELLDAELSLLKRMGFNGTYTPMVDSNEAAAFYQQHGLAQHFGIVTESLYVKNGCHNQPDIEKMEAVYSGLAKKYAPILDKIERIKYADEPSGQ